MYVTFEALAIDDCFWIIFVRVRIPHKGKVRQIGHKKLNKLNRTVMLHKIDYQRGCPYHHEPTKVLENVASFRRRPTYR